MPSFDRFDHPLDREHRIGPIEPEENHCEICHEESPLRMYGMAVLCDICAEQAGLEVEG